jgi:hypothetical protein
MKPFSGSREARRKQTRRSVPALDQGDYVMWDFINELYRDFCLARLQEMRKLEHHI